MTSRQRHRPEIDGLRAVSVIAVLIFHLSPRALPGGFLGVDVFFVISGYLITQVLVADIDAGMPMQMIAARFYRRRVMRIMPLYVAVSLGCLVAGWYLMLPTDFAATLRTALYGTAFQANRVLAETTDYFSPVADTQPLLHTWSLSIEEQFYLVWPVFLLVISRRLGPRRLQITIAVTLVLLAMSQLLATSVGGAAFFWLRARAYEPLLGACLALYIHAHPQRLLGRPVLGGIALVALIASFFVIDRSSDLPGLAALGPTACAAALILCGGPVRDVLSLAPMVAIGRISYSIYLLHWPLLCFVRYLGVEIDFWIGAVLVAITVAVSVGTHRWIEEKLRYRPWQLPVCFGALVILPIAVVGGAQMLAWRTDDFADRLGDRARTVLAVQRQFPHEIRRTCHGAPLHALAHCTLGADGTATAMLWGDSHANHYTGLFDEIGSARGRTIREVTANTCPPILDGVGLTSDCLQRNSAVVSELTANPQLVTVYLAAAWSKADLSSLGATIDTLRGVGKRVVIVAEVPELPIEQVSCPIKAAHHAWLELSCETADRRATQQATLLAIVHRTGATVMDVPALFCDGTACRQVLEGVPLYRYGDRGHLNDGGARALGRALLRASAANAPW